MRKIIICENQFESLFKRSRLITENRASKNQSLARKMVRELSPNTNDKEFTEKVLHDIPSVRKENFHLFPAVVRFLLQNPTSINADTLLKLNKFISVAAAKSKELNLDQNLNGMPLDEFFRNFEGFVNQADKANRENTAHYGKSNGHNNGYTIVPIPSFAEASEYSKYVTWCVTHRSKDFINYVGIGKGLFYFLLKDGFEKVPKKVGENAPLDDYGLSMIAVSFNEEGGIISITCRWNHDNGGSDSVMTPEQVSELIGSDIYSIFNPDDIQNEFLKNVEIIDEINDEDIMLCKNKENGQIFVSSKDYQRQVYFKDKSYVLYQSDYDEYGKVFEAIVAKDGRIIVSSNVESLTFEEYNNLLFIGDTDLSEGSGIYNAKTLERINNERLCEVDDKGAAIQLYNEDKYTNFFIKSTNKLLFNEWLDNVSTVPVGNLIIAFDGNMLSLYSYDTFEKVMDWVNILAYSKVDYRNTLFLVENNGYYLISDYNGMLNKKPITKLYKIVNQGRINARYIAKCDNEMIGISQDFATIMPVNEDEFAIIRYESEIVEVNLFDEFIMHKK